MKGKLWWFIAKFVLVSVPLFVLWVWKAESWYLALLGGSLRFVVIDLAGLKPACFPAPQPILLNLIPYVSLMVITEGMRTKLKIIRVVEGVVILFVWHMILTELVYLLLDCQGTTQGYEKLSVPLYLISGTIPFILWILFAPKQVASLFSRKRRRTK